MVDRIAHPDPKGSQPATAKVDLCLHNECGNYRYWRSYLDSDKESAVLELQFNSVQDYVFKGLNATARNRFNYAGKHGYSAQMITWDARNAFIDDIYKINTSAEVRQGRPMSESYTKRPEFITNTSDTCSAHYSRFFGVFYGAELVGYINGSFCGHLAAASQILGHAEHLKAGIMYKVWVAFVEYCMQNGIRTIVYSRWSDGVDGLRIWKRAVGLKPIILKEA